MRILSLLFTIALSSQIALAGLHDDYDALLKKYVSETGVVNYVGMKNQHEVLKSYLVELDKNKPLNSDSRKAQLAYWINLYNATTLNLILENYPVKSITDLHGGKPWDQKIIKMGDKMISLNQVENEIIRPQFKEPRIHFAVNCAAKSCPKLLNEAFTAEKLEEQLTKQAKSFLANKEKNKISTDAIEISKIFEWYRSDFEMNGTLIDFINNYATTKINSNAKVKFMEYDWSLNE